MANNEKNFGDAPPRYDEPQAGYPPNPGYPGGYPPAGYTAYQPGAYPPPQAGYPPPQAGYPPPQAGYPPPQAGYPSAGAQVTNQNTIVVTQPGSSAVPGGTNRYLQHPAMIKCQHCQATVTTSLEYEVGLLTWVIAGIICLVGCWLGCCLIPFCIDAAKDVVHRCPNCQQVVGKYSQFH